MNENAEASEMVPLLISKPLCNFSTIIVLTLLYTTMGKKVFALVSGIVGAVQTAAVAIVTYTCTENATVINSCIVVAGTAIVEICTMFVKQEEA